MEDVVAVAIDLESGQSRFFLTWGRIFDPIDGTRLEEFAMQVAANVRLDGVAVRAHVCDSLQEAARERYFYESLFEMGQMQIPHGGGYAEWKTARAEALAAGREWWYLGVPLPPVVL